MWVVKEKDLSPDTKCDNCDEFANLMIRMKSNDICLCSECKNGFSKLIKIYEMIL